MDAFTKQTVINIPKIIVITGGSCSGKTSFSKFLANHLDGKVLVLAQDNYFIDYSIYSQNELENINFDVPDAFLTHILVSNIEDICNNRSTDLPTYDFVNHRIGHWTKYADSPDYIIIEGIMTFECEKLMDIASLTIFIDTPMDIMLWRRINRDNSERFFDLNSTLSRYKRFVRQSYLKYILPHKQHSDVIIDGEAIFDFERMRDIQQIINNIC